MAARNLLKTIDGGTNWSCRPIHGRNGKAIVKAAVFGLFSTIA